MRSASLTIQKQNRKGSEKMAVKNKAEQLVTMIDYKRQRKGYTVDELAKLLGVKRNTYYVRKRNPEGFTLLQLQIAAKKLEIAITISPDGTVKAEGEL